MGLPVALEVWDKALDSRRTLWQKANLPFMPLIGRRAAVVASMMIIFEVMREFSKGIVRIDL